MGYFKKTETIDEFLARGGKITVLDFIQPEKTPHSVPSPPPRQADLMTLSDGQFYFAQKSKRKKNAKAEDAKG